MRTNLLPAAFGSPFDHGPVPGLWQGSVGQLASEHRTLYWNQNRPQRRSSLGIIRSFRDFSLLAVGRFT
jgi:hypothetical protein